MHNASCVCNSYFLQQSSQSTHLAVKRNIMLDGEGISKHSLTGLAGPRLTGWVWWSRNNLHSVSGHILVIWRGTQIGHMRTHSGVHPLHKGATIQTIIHVHTHYIHTNRHTNAVSVMHTFAVSAYTWQKITVTYLDWDHCWQSPSAVQLWSS